MSNKQVLVPFYRGAVVFNMTNELIKNDTVFSSPFIEERLYLWAYRMTYLDPASSRPLLSRSGCI